MQHRPARITAIDMFEPCPAQQVRFPGGQPEVKTLCFDECIDNRQETPTKTIPAGFARTACRSHGPVTEPPGHPAERGNRHVPSGRNARPSGSGHPAGSAGKLPARPQQPQRLPGNATDPQAGNMSKKTFHAWLMLRTAPKRQGLYSCFLP
ncbi:MAG: hypothetical protein H6851_12990 [Geminicoccaceae bacterium]|nr:hypothetical protein [Geminicoccaceae bacterium]